MARSELRPFPIHIHSFAFFYSTSANERSARPEVARIIVAIRADADVSFDLQRERVYEDGPWVQKAAVP